MHFRCQDEQDQKHLFTVQKNAGVSLLLLKSNISTRYPTSNFAIAKSSMASYPWTRFVKANIRSALIYPELWRKPGGFYHHLGLCMGCRKMWFRSQNEHGEM